MNIFTVSFFGHRYLENLPKISQRLERYIKELITEKEYVEFLVGRNGDYDILSASAVKSLQKKYRNDNSSLILILPYQTADYLNNTCGYENYYDEIEISSSASSSFPKAAFSIRNQEMINRSDLIICYNDHETGGTFQTLQYAKKAGKRIINLADEI